MSTDSSPDVSYVRPNYLKTYSRREPLCDGRSRKALTTVTNLNIFDNDSVQSADPFDQLLSEYRRNPVAKKKIDDIPEEEEKINEFISPYLVDSYYNFDDASKRINGKQKKNKGNKNPASPKTTDAANKTPPPHEDFSEIEKYSFIYSSDEIITPSSDGVVKKKKKVNKNLHEPQESSVSLVDSDDTQSHDSDTNDKPIKRRSTVTDLTEENISHRSIIHSGTLETSDHNKSKASDYSPWIEGDSLNISEESLNISRNNVFSMYHNPRKSKIYTSTPVDLSKRYSVFESFPKQSRTLSRLLKNNTIYESGEASKLNHHSNISHNNLLQCYVVLERITHPQELGRSKSYIPSYKTRRVHRNHGSFCRLHPKTKLQIPFHEKKNLRINRKSNVSLVSKLNLSSTPVNKHKFQNSTIKIDYPDMKNPETPSISKFLEKTKMDPSVEQSCLKMKDVSSIMRKRHCKSLLRRISSIPSSYCRFEYSRIHNKFISVCHTVDKTKKSSQKSRISKFIANTRMNASNSRRKSHLESLTPSLHSETKSSFQKVMEYCKQTQPISFASFIRKFTKIVKLGEGSYGEVFRISSTQAESAFALKVVPIEGSFTVNGNEQKTFTTILPEVAISMELNELGNNDENKTVNFIKVNKVSSVKGKYPKKLLTAWDDYARNFESENERPVLFQNDQIYIAFQFADGGVDLEHFKFSNYLQAHSVFLQTAITLAVAENALMFEHRDLHWGNVLVQTVDNETIEYVLQKTPLHLQSKGVFVTIIDFTLSRLEGGGVIVSNDLNEDPDLFTGDASVDYQFEVYRQMQIHTKGDWESFHPYTNILWLHYLLNKLVHCKRYSEKRKHRSVLDELRGWEESILSFTSATEFVEWIKTECKAIFI